jgi:glycosyltransferase involved in cell wall biosynthesis
MSTVTARPPTIAVIMPAFNEAGRIDRTITTIARYRAGSGGNVQAVFVADDGSTDDTVAVAHAAAAREGMDIDALSFPHRGKALTVRSAMLAVAERSDADYLMMLDADDELRIDQLDRVDWSPDPRAVYIGRRDEGSERGSAKPTPVRRLMSLAMRTASLPAPPGSRPVQPAALVRLDVRCRDPVRRSRRVASADRRGAGGVDATRCQQGSTSRGGSERSRLVRDRVESAP